MFKFDRFEELRTARSDIIMISNQSVFLSLSFGVCGGIAGEMCSVGYLSHSYLIVGAMRKAPRMEGSNENDISLFSFKDSPIREKDFPFIKFFGHSPTSSPNSNKHQRIEFI